MAHRRIIVLLNLKPGKTAADYERWARTTDLPTVSALASVAGFEVFRSASLLGSDAKPPYAYIEVLDIENLERFGADIGTDTMKRVAAEFQEWADPVFVLTEKVG